MMLLGYLMSLVIANGLTVPDKLLHATAWVRASAQGVGTGWVVDAERRWLVTNSHVVGEQDRVEAFFVVEENGRPITERSYYLENQKKLHEDGQAVRGRVILRRPSSDLALIELDKLPPGTGGLKLAEALPGPGQQVQSIGHRHDAEALWLSCTGEVRQIGRLTDGYFWRGKKLAENVPCLIAQLPILPGDSGGPLVNEHGDVVGVISGLRAAPSTAIAIQADEVRLLLTEAKKLQFINRDVAVEASTLVRKLTAATGWVRPTATEGRSAGFVIDRQRRLLLTTNSGAGSSDLVDVLFARLKKNDPVAELAAYADRTGLRQEGLLVRGLVVARDPKRDLALIELESLPATAEELAFAGEEPKPAVRLHSVSHPSGVELLWLYSAGVVRQTAHIELVTTAKGEPVKPRTLLLQIPHQAGSSGGPLVNGEGEVVGLLAAKEGAQQQLGYAITSAELKLFLESSRPLIAPKSASEHHARGMFLLARGRHRDGVASLERAIEKEPENVEFRRDLVDASYALGQSKAAQKHLDALLKLEPMSEEHRVRVARTLEPKFAQAIASFTIQKDRQCALAWLVRGSLDETKEALADLDEAIFLAPGLAEAYRRRANVHEKLGDDQKALADWSRAIELDAYSPEPIRRRAALYLKLNDPKRAVADAERLIELQPRDASAYRELERAWLARGEDAAAIAALVAALRWQPTFWNSLLEDILAAGAEMNRRWPDDPKKSEDWYRKSLGAAREYVDHEKHAGIDAALKSNEIEKQIRAMIKK